MSDVYHFFNCQCCLLLKNKCLQFRLATFPQKGPTVLNTIWSGQMLHLQLYVDWKLLDYVHHYNWHGPMVFFNKLFSLSLSLILWRSVFEYCVQVFPCVHTLEDGAQVAHPIIFPDNQVFLFFYCFNCHDSEKSKLGVFRVLKFCYMVSHPTFCHFFQFCIWFMVSPASFQVGCRSYIPLIVYFAHNDVNSIWAWTGNVLLYGPMSTVPQR